MPTTANATSVPSYTVVVNDTKPMWLYCSQAKHCQDGMAMVINPPRNRTIQDYKAAAAAVVGSASTEASSLPVIAATNSDGTVDDPSLVNTTTRLPAASTSGGDALRLRAAVLLLAGIIAL